MPVLSLSKWPVPSLSKWPVLSLSKWPVLSVPAPAKAGVEARHRTHVKKSGLAHACARSRALSTTFGTFRRSAARRCPAARRGDSPLTCRQLRQLRRTPRAEAPASIRGPFLRPAL